ncbi:MAG: glycosyltransferase family 4 protein [Thermodesulfobacteriota bacterium]
MRLLVTHEIHARQVVDRFYNLESAVIGYPELCNYRYAIGEIMVVCRSRQAGHVHDGWFRIDGQGVTVCSMPEPDRPWSLPFQLPRMLKAASGALRKCDRYLLRLPGPTGAAMGLLLWVTGRGYGVELAGHASEGLLEVKGRSPAIRFMARVSDFLTRKLVHRAQCVAYRSHHLRGLYPNRRSEREWVFSGARLDERVIRHPRNPEWFERQPTRIIYVGRLQPEKGVMDLLDAFESITGGSSTLELAFIGDGPLASTLRSEIDRRGLETRVRLTGRIPHGSELFAELDRAHLMVLPSRTEGMPRALIEAMAAGLPAIGSRVGGIPELLPSDCLFPPRNPNVMAELILRVICDRGKLSEMSLRGFEISKSHWKAGLDAAKQGFWKAVVEYCK